MFLLPQINLDLRPKLLDLKPGTRIVSNTFTMGEWQEDDKATVNGDCGAWCTAFLWIVPAKVQGSWRSPQGDLELVQSFQMVSGTLRSGANSTPIADGRLRGDQLGFTVGTAAYSGRVSGNTIEGTVTSGTSRTDWRATR
jgi:hypothetical protein